MIQLWAAALFANPGACADAEPFFQDIGVDDLTTGKASSIDLSGYACLDAASVAITGILDLGGVRAVAPADTWRFSGKTEIISGGGIMCVTPPENPQYDAPVITYYLEGSSDGSSWFTVGGYSAAATGNVQRNGDFTLYANPSIRYLRLVIYMSYYKLLQYVTFRATITDMRISITSYVPPTSPPPREKRNPGVKGAEAERCVDQE